MKRHLVLAFCALLASLPGCSDDKADEPSAMSSEPLSPTCDVPGFTRCSEDGTAVIECRAAREGSFVWATRSACGPFGACNKGVCVCDDPCSLHAMRCTGDTIERCRLDHFGCLYWEKETRCGDKGKLCATDGALVRCTGGCDTAGELRCVSDVLEQCTENEQGYLDWEVVADCAVSEQVCGEAAGVPECISP